MRLNNYLSSENPEPFSSGEYSPKRKEFLTYSPRELTPGGRLRRERLLRKMTIEQLSEKLDVSSAYLGAVERGKRPISSKFMHKLHNILGISYDFLFAGVSHSEEELIPVVQENTAYSARHNVDILLNISTPSELVACYNMYHSYLTETRKRRFDSKNDPTEEKA